MSEQTNLIADLLISLNVTEYNISRISSPKINGRYGEINSTTIPLNHTGPDLLVIPGFGIKSHNNMLKILIEGIEFLSKFRKIIIINFGEKIKTLSKAWEDLFDDARYKKEDEFKKELAEILDKLIRGPDINLSNFTVLAKSAGGGVAFFLAGINPEVKVLMAACPGFHNNGTVVRDRQDLKIYIMWNMDDDVLDYDEVINEDGTIKKSKRIEIMKQLKLQGNDVTFYSYDDGGHELNVKFLEDTQ